MVRKVVLVGAFAVLIHAMTIATVCADIMSYAYAYSSYVYVYNPVVHAESTGPTQPPFGFVANFWDYGDAAASQGSGITIQGDFLEAQGTGYAACAYPPGTVASASSAWDFAFYLDVPVEVYLSGDLWLPYPPDEAHQASDYVDFAGPLGVPKVAFSAPGAFGLFCQGPPGYYSIDAYVAAGAGYIGGDYGNWSLNLVIRPLAFLPLPSTLLLLGSGLLGLAGWRRLMKS